MFERELSNISSLIRRVVGEPRRDGDITGWTEYNCPRCADDAGVETDGKYNLCTNIDEGYFHCWSCGYAGKISRLLMDYGGRDIANEYYEQINSIRNSKEYQIHENCQIVKSEVEDGIAALRLPDGCKPITKEDKNSYAAYQYLKNRGIDYEMIKDYDIRYVGWSDDFKMRNRIIIPSYDQYCCLNYYVARDYTGKQKIKYCNADVPKKDIIFNEGRVNWTEDIYLCEGPMDALSLPNSIPLLGKVIDGETAVYDALINKARANVVIVLDDDAIYDERKIYRFLDSGVLKGRVRAVECPKGYDAALYFQTFGSRGIAHLLMTARKFSDFELVVE